MIRPFTLMLLCAVLMACKGSSNIFRIDNEHKVVFLDSIQAAKEINEDNINSYFKQVSNVDISIQTKSNCPTTEACQKSYREFLSRDVESFTDAEIKNLSAIYKKAYSAISKINPALLIKEVQLIKTKGNHYGPSAFYTRENIIVIPKPMIENMAAQEMEEITYHELFHIISRYRPKLKDALYGLIGFSKVSAKIVLPDALKNRLLLNPDGIDMDYSIVLTDTTNQKKYNALPLIISNESKYIPEKPEFFNYLKFSLYPLENSDSEILNVVADDKGLSPLQLNQIGDFFSQIKDNTGYIIHPDEILAENFRILITEQSEEDKAKRSKEGIELLDNVASTLKEFKP